MFSVALIFWICVQTSRSFSVDRCECFCISIVFVKLLVITILNKNTTCCSPATLILFYSMCTNKLSQVFNETLSVC